MAQSLFRSIKNAPTPRQMAVEFAQQDIEEYRATRMMLPDGAPEPAENIERLKRLGVLMRGPHGVAIKPIVERAFPSLRQPEGHA